MMLTKQMMQKLRPIVPLVRLWQAECSERGDQYTASDVVLDGPGDEKLLGPHLPWEQ
jgi:hypothetical protein